MKTKEIGIFILLSIVLIAFRFSTNIENIITIGGSSIKTIPWSDAAGWVAGSEYIQRGEVMSEFPSRRPLYPAFLSLLFSLTGGAYLGAIICQIVLFSFASMACFYLLRNNDEKYAVAFFLSCIVLWLPSTQSLFLTENLGAIFLIISFGFLWRGIQDKSKELYGTGLFFLSMSFSVRPWAAGCLLTLPLLPLVTNQKFKENLNQVAFFIFMISLGIIINSISSALFATPATASNYPQTLYGLVSNTLNWRAASLDPIISQYMQVNANPASLNKIIYQRCFDIFIENPMLFFFSLKTVYIFYFREILAAFSREVYLYPAVMILWLVLISKKYEKINRFIYIVLLLVLLMILTTGNYAFIFFIFYGIICLFLKRHSVAGKFGLFYIFGIMISLPAVGIDGGSRVRIASDIFLFFLCALSVQQLLCPIQQTWGTVGFSSNKQRNIFPLTVISACFLSLVFIPWLIHLHGKNIKEYLPEKKLLLPAEVSSQLAIQVNPLSTSELDTIGKKWPDPSYETVDGKTAYRLIRYTDRDAIFFNANEWVSIQLAEFWPMGRFDPPIARTVFTRSWCIFPNISKEFLKQFDNLHIYVAGKIIGQPRQWKYDTGYALLVSHIGVPTDNGAVIWREISSLIQ